MIVGGFTEMKDTTRPFGQSVEEVIRDILSLFLPVCFGFPGAMVLVYGIEDRDTFTNCTLITAIKFARNPNLPSQQGIHHMLILWKTRQVMVSASFDADKPVSCLQQFP